MRYNWFIITDSSNTFDTVNRTAVLAKVVSHLRVGAHAVFSRALQREIKCWDLLDEFGGVPGDLLLQKDAARIPCYKAGDV